MNSNRLASLVLLACFLVTWQSAARNVRSAEKVTPHHLVGHEDAALLLRVQDVIDDWDPRKLENPLVITSRARDAAGNEKLKKQLRRPDLAEFIADIDAV